MQLESWKKTVSLINPLVEARVQYLMDTLARQYEAEWGPQNEIVLPKIAVKIGYPYDVNSITDM